MGRTILASGARILLRVAQLSGLPGRIPLTISSVKKLLEQCHNLTELRISDWSVTSEEFRSLAASIRDNNWDLTVTRKSRL